MASSNRILFSGSSDPAAKHRNQRLSDRLSRELFHEKLESAMKQEPDDDDDDDCFLDEAMPPPTPGQPTRVRSHSKSLRAMANPSAVWAHFDLCPNDPLRAQCRICGSVVVRGGANPRQCGTTNLHRHLRVHHGGRLIGRRYHVMQSSSQGSSTGRTIRIASQHLLRPPLSPAPPRQTSQKSPKKFVIKTIPLKMKPVAPTTIKLPPRQQQQQESVNQPQTSVPQPSPEVCLRWNSYHSNMQNSFPSLLDSEEFVDVTLACEGRSLKCHKMILSSCSDYLATLLRENPCQHPIILMKDLKFWEIEALVKFMYRGEVNVAHDKLPELLNAAEALQVKGLAGPTPSQNTKPPMLIPQSKPLNRTPSPTFRVTSAAKETKSTTVASTATPMPTSPKRTTKRSLQDSVENSRPFTKIRLQRPVTPTSPTAAIKLEPLDIPLSPTDIFPGTNDDSSTTNYENLMSMHEDDDPGGDDRGESADDNDINFPTLSGPQNLNDAEDNMEFVPTDFLEQEQDLVDDDPDCSRSSIEEATETSLIIEEDLEDDEPHEENSSKKDKT